VPPGDIITFLQQNGRGVVLLIALLAAVLFGVQWVLWMFGLGRFKPSDLPRSNTLRFLVAEALVKIINDFRHLLALLLIIIFGLALAYCLWQAGSLADLKDSLQVVMATLGGLVGSIIGYYFGESKGAAVAATQPNVEPPQVPSTQIVPTARPDDAVGQ
jgi:hypothetical protein